MKVERSMQLNATPDEVRQLVMDPNRLGDWVSIHQNLEDAPRTGSCRRGPSSPSA